jgi:hypothetical protein
MFEFQIGHAETKVLSHTKVKNVHLYGTVTHISNLSTQGCGNSREYAGLSPEIAQE